MRILLDTHIFLWFISDDKRLDEEKSQAIANLGNDVYLSVVSVWECIIKYQIGKLAFSESPDLYLPRLRSQHLIKTLEIDESTVRQLVKLPNLNKDPFDRLLLCQALEKGFKVMTEDEVMLKYPRINFWVAAAEAEDLGRERPIE